MTKRFAGKVMMITGAAQGIGERVAELAANEGAKLVLVDRSPLVQDLRKRLKDITDVGGDLLFEASPIGSPSVLVKRLDVAGA